MMNYKRLLILSTIVIVLAGCSSLGSPSETKTPTETLSANIPTEVNTTDKVCIRETQQEFDPQHTLCLVDERPPDIRVENHDNKTHTISIQIIKDNATVVFAENVTLGPRSDGESPQQIFEDVIDLPGEYLMKGVLDGEEVSAHTWTVGERYADKGKGEVQWEFVVNPNGQIYSWRIPSQ